jgi:hypothetical protein
MAKPNLETLIFEHLWEEAKDLTEELAEAGADEEKAARAVAEFLDSIVPLDKVISGKLGELAEEADGLVFEAVAVALARLFKVDPEKRAARRKRRKERQEIRRKRRAERRARRKERKEEE